MLPSLKRIATLLLIPCLLADPSVAASRAMRDSSSTPLAETQPVFQRQGITAAVVYVHRAFHVVTYPQLQRAAAKQANAIAPSDSLVSSISVGRWIRNAVLAITVTLGALGISLPAHSQYAPTPIAQTYKAVPIPDFNPAVNQVTMIVDTDVKLEEAQTLVHSVHALTESIYAQLLSAHSPDLADFEMYRRLVYSRVKIEDLNYPTKAISVLYTPKTYGVESRIILNLKVMNKLLTAATKGNPAARHKLQTSFIETGHLLRVEDGSILLQLISDGITTLKSDTTTALPALALIKRAVETWGMELQPFDGAAAGVIPHWYTNKDKSGSECDLTTFVDRGLYQTLLQRMKQSPAQAIIAKQLVWMLLVKEGGGLREILDRPDITFRLLQMRMDFEKQILDPKLKGSLAAQVADSALVEEAKKTMAIETALEADGYESMIDYANDLHWTPEFVQERLKIEHDPIIHLTWDRTLTMLTLVRPLTGFERRFKIRANVFNFDVRLAMQKQFDLILADAVKRGIALPHELKRPSLLFLMDPAYTGKSVMKEFPMPKASLNPGPRLIPVGRSSLLQLAA